MKIRSKQHYLWRAVDQDGEVVDVFVQKRRNGAAAKRFFKRLQSDGLLVNPGQLLIFPSGSFISVENRSASGAYYTADCISYPDEMVESVFHAEHRVSTKQTTIFVPDCPPGLVQMIRGFNNATTELDELVELIRHRLLEPLVWLKSLGVRLSVQSNKPLDCRLRDLLSKDVSKKWRVTEVSKDLGVSEATLRRRLKEAGTSFSRILMDTRLEQVRILFKMISDSGHCLKVIIYFQNG